MSSLSSPALASSPGAAPWSRFAPTTASCSSPAQSSTCLGEAAPEVLGCASTAPLRTSSRSSAASQMAASLGFGAACSASNCSCIPAACCSKSIISLVLASISACKLSWASSSSGFAPAGLSPTSSPASSPHSRLSSTRATSWASRTLRCCVHMSCTAVSICVAPSKRCSIFCRCKSRRLLMTSSALTRFCSCSLRACNMRRSSSSGSPSAPQPLSNKRKLPTQACWSSAVSWCICTRIRLS
mmetsp:Transcript_32373/g.75157  ORF Transcript_32373/g.75157 Transcript_32373/m.75157 type:complete len:242 (+) Transcript_32373:296-1021(+)